jgi:hypothetical protein
VRCIGTVVLAAACGSDVDYPLLFGRDRQPKPAFDAVVSVPAGSR